MDAPTHGCAPLDRTVFGREELGRLFGGMDTHKDPLAVALIDPSGRRQDAITVANTVAGHGQLMAWLADRGPSPPASYGPWRSWDARPRSGGSGLLPQR